MQQQQNPYHCHNLFLYPTVSQIKTGVMLFLSTRHMNSPQMNQTVFQCHHSTHPMHMQHSRESRPKLTPKICIFVFHQISMSLGRLR